MSDKNHATVIVQGVRRQRGGAIAGRRRHQHTAGLTFQLDRVGDYRAGFGLQPCSPAANAQTALSNQGDGVVGAARGRLGGHRLDHVKARRFFPGAVNIGEVNVACGSGCIQAVDRGQQAGYAGRCAHGQPVGHQVGRGRRSALQHGATGRFQINVAFGGDFIERDIELIVGIAHHQFGAARRQILAGIEECDLDVASRRDRNIRRDIAVRQISIGQQSQVNDINCASCVQGEVAVRHLHLGQRQLACASYCLVYGDIARLASGGDQGVDIGAQVEGPAQLGLQHVGSCQ